MAYLHGTYGAFDKSIGLVPVATDTIPVYVGIAPVNLVRGYEEMGNVNGPLQVKNMEGVCLAIPGTGNLFHCVRSLPHIFRMRFPMYRPLWSSMYWTRQHIKKQENPPHRN